MRSESVPVKGSDPPSAELHANDVLVLFTDGLTEAAASDGDMFGDERLEDAVRAITPDLTARDVLLALEGACRGWLRGVEPEDDLTLLVMRVDGGSAGGGSA